MKDYPIDKFLPFVAWPLLTATRVTSKAGKAGLMLIYVPWVGVLMPMIGVLLFVSIIMWVWDDVNKRPA